MNETAAVDIVEKTQAHIESVLKNDVTGHDVWHTLRVHRLAKYIAQKEFPGAVQILVVELGALLHDIALRPLRC